jgi:hypothetical protein
MDRRSARDSGGADRHDAARCGISNRSMVGVYFEVAAAIVALVLLGEWLELRARGRTSAAIRQLLGLAPKTAQRGHRNGNRPPLLVAQDDGPLSLMALPACRRPCCADPLSGPLTSATVARYLNRTPSALFQLLSRHPSSTSASEIFKT